MGWTLLVASDPGSQCDAMQAILRCEGYKAEIVRDVARTMRAANCTGNPMFICVAIAPDGTPLNGYRELVYYLEAKGLGRLA